MDRRTFLVGGAALAAVALAPTGLQAAEGRANALHAYLASAGIHSRALWLERPQSGETLQCRYAQGTTLLRTGYLDACRLLRDVRAEAWRPIDPRLLDILSAIQAWVAIETRQRRPLTILSGYRSAQTNRRTKGAARNSMHLRGMAADFRIDGIPSPTLARLAKWLAEGGVGVYPDKGFIHVDTGRVRAWRG